MTNFKTERFLLPADGHATNSDHPDAKVYYKLDLSITMRILLLKYCNASPSSSHLKICSKLCEFYVRLEHHNRHHSHCHSRCHSYSRCSLGSLGSVRSRHSCCHNNIVVIVVIVVIVIVIVVMSS